MPRNLAPAADQIADRLRALITEDGRSIGDIAEASGMSASQLSQILTGVRPNPTAQTLARLLAAMGKRWRDLD